MSLQAIRFDKQNTTLQILDQLLLPYTTQYIDVTNISDAYNVIKNMQVRGAPAIAIVATFAVLVDTHNKVKVQGKQITQKDFVDLLDYLISSRPTAVNLANALNDLRQIVADQDEITDEVYAKIDKYANNLYEDDLANNYKIGANGLKYITQSLEEEGFKGAFSILTICNTGSLATSGHGTALGIIRSTHEALKEELSNKPFHLAQVFPCETRPYNQGAKLTSYELKHDKIPFTLVCDNMVLSLVREQLTKAPVKFIIIGADRIVKNGDTANKIGSFQLSTIASFFNQTQNTNIKFIVAAPRTTIDFSTEQGLDIVIEQRPSDELTTIKGPALDASGNAGEKIQVGIAPQGISVWNPAFDVTPHELIDAIVTEDEKVYTKTNGKFDLSK